ncbi:MAG: purine-binding chemotaxis protein CheW [Gallionellaceae bacterium]|nr:MAG: purine-binding chemotaxis protein CheW [Gallionellaceae bacterium]
MGAIVRSGQQTGGTPGEAVGEEEQNQYLTFLLGGEMFAIPILNIKEIIEYGSLTTVPMMPEFIRGVINLRGSVVPVVELSVRFGREASPVTKRTCIVIIEIESEGEKQDVGVMVDSVSEVLEIHRADVEQAPSFGARIRSDFIRGMGKIAGKFVIILNVNRVLSIDEMAMLGQAGGAKQEAAMLPG